MNVHDNYFICCYCKQSTQGHVIGNLQKKLKLGLPICCFKCQCKHPSRKKSNYSGIPRRFTSLLSSVRSRFYGYYIKGVDSFEDILGISYLEFYTYINSKLHSGMTWTNYGSFWHLDHIIPCASFNFKNPDDVRKCFNWANFQPLTARENLRKNDFMSDGRRARDIRKGFDG